MKTIILTCFILAALVQQDPLSQLIGKWKLMKVETEDNTIFPTKKEFYLEISEENIGYNLDINTCGTSEFTIDTTHIKLGFPECTEVCCDGTIDSIANYIWMAPMSYKTLCWSSSMRMESCF